MSLRNAAEWRGGAMQAPPFFMYTTRELPLFHRELRGCLLARGRAVERSVLDDQHTTGYWMHQQLYAHPSRLTQPRKAAVLIVPFWMKVSWTLGDCNGTSHLVRVRKMLLALNATHAFHHNARRHILPSSSFMLRVRTRGRHSGGSRTRATSCIGPWSGNIPDFRYFPEDQSLQHIVRRLTVSHMEQPSPRLCDAMVPGTNITMYLRWPPPWWSRTLVLPCMLSC
jgi:hypothetical protein